MRTPGGDGDKGGKTTIKIKILGDKAKASDIKEPRVNDLLGALEDFTKTSRGLDQSMSDYVELFEEKMSWLQKCGGAVSSKNYALFLLKNANIVKKDMDNVASKVDFWKDDEDVYEKTKTALLNLVNDVDNEKFMRKLPREIWQIVLSFLSDADLASMARTCYPMRLLCYDSWTKVSVPLKDLKPKRKKESFDAFMGLTKMKSITLRGLERDDENLSRVIISKQVMGSVVKNKESLTKLYLGGSIESKAVLGNLHLLHKLTSLTINHQDDSSIPGVDAISALENLEELKITSVCQHALVTIFNSLKKLRVVSLVHADDMSINALARNNPGLEQVSLFWRVSAPAVVSLCEACPGLKQIHLTSCCCVKHHDVVEITNHCSHLQAVSLIYCGMVTDQTLDSLSNNCPKMEKLRIKQMPTKDITLKGVRKAVKNASSLSTLEISDFSGLSKEMKGKLRKENPSVKFIFPGFCRLGSDPESYIRYVDF